MTTLIPIGGKKYKLVLRFYGRADLKGSKLDKDSGVFQTFNVSVDMKTNRPIIIPFPNSEGAIDSIGVYEIEEAE